LLRASYVRSARVPVHVHLNRGSVLAAALDELPRVIERPLDELVGAAEVDW
jgi:hypothetical protein